MYCALLDLDQPLYRMWAGIAPRISLFWGWHGEFPYKSEPKHDCHCIYRLRLSKSTFYMSFPHIYSLGMPKNTTALQRYTAKPHFGYFTSRGFSLSASEVVCSVVSVCGSLRAVNLFSWDKKTFAAFVALEQRGMWLCVREMFFPVDGGCSDVFFLMT